MHPICLTLDEKPLTAIISNDKMLNVNHATRYCRWFEVSSTDVMAPGLRDTTLLERDTVAMEERLAKLKTTMGKERERRERWKVQRHAKRCPTVCQEHRTPRHKP